MMHFVNQKTIDGRLYTAFRDPSKKAKREMIESEGVRKVCVLKEVWNDEEKLTELFK